MIYNKVKPIELSRNTTIVILESKPTSIRNRNLKRSRNTTIVILEWLCIARWCLSDYPSRNTTIVILESAEPEPRKNVYNKGRNTTIVILELK